MSEKIVLIDGHSILNRAFYGVPDLTNAEGLHTNAVYGFLNIMFKILEEEKPEYLTVAFDVHAPTFRHEMFPEYKGTRKPMADELRQQVPVIKDVLRAMGIVVLEQAGVEADDILGTIGRRAEEAGLDVATISGDRDLLQLATEKVKIRIPKTKQGKTTIEDYYAADVLERYQVTPTAFIDLKALMGDASDNIPGVPSIGEKTATKIIVEYGSIEEAYKHVEELKPPRASKAMSEHYDLAELSKILATINTKVELNYNLEDAKIHNLYTQEAYEWFQELEFKNLLARFDLNEVQSQKSIDIRATILTDTSEIQQFLEELKEYPLVGLALDKEGPEVLPLFAHPSGFGGVSLSLGEDKNYILRAEYPVSIEKIFEMVEHALQNVKQVSAFDIKSLLPYISISEHVAFDGIVAAYLLNPLKNNYNFEDVAREQLGLFFDEQIVKDCTAGYAAYTAFACVPKLEAALKHTKMFNLYRDIEIPLIYTLFEMEQNGVKVEGDALKIYSQELGEKIVALESEIYESAGEEFNINSPKQLGVILFEKLELPHGKKTKTGYSTSADVLEKLATEYPIVNKILEYRQLAKLKSTYADGLGNYISNDGRIHGTFNQTITATGRISSTEPNLQNIPIRMELGRLIRKVFVPAKDYVFVDADYSQIELRILAHCSGDEQLIEAYKMASDIHKITASQVFHTPYEEVSDLQRRNAKAVNFGIVYGISAFGLSQDLEISRKEAQEYIDRYFSVYPGIKRFLDDAVTHAKQSGYVVTEFGRRRPIPELASSNFMQRNFGERVAMNAPIQGAAADIMKIAMNDVRIELQKRKLRSKLVLQVHDELLIEAHKDEIEIVEEILKTKMEGAANLSVNLEIDMHQGETWYEAK
ncbi:MAG: DNA polymerase I [Eubacteriales bacterium]